MLKRFAVPVIFLISLSFMAFYSTGDKAHGYIGAKKCGMCHKKDKAGAQLRIWEKSAHANAFKTLKSKESDKIAAEAGYTTPAAETEFCLKCHASGYNTAKELIGKKFKVEDGVQCETCHGPGEDYKSSKIMKDRKKSIENGLIAWENEKEIEEMCKTCHNPESPTYKEFDFKKRFEEIKHYIPEK